MGETFAFYIATEVLGKLGSLAYEEISLAWGLKSKLNKLEGTLTTIKTMLLDAEEQQAKNRQLSLWLGKLKDVCYDADDVLDEFEYEALWRKVVKRGGINSKVQNSFSSSISLALRFKMGYKIKEIREKLDEIAVEKDRFHLTGRVENRHVVQVERETHSFVEVSDVIGRDDDKEKIVQLLMEISDHENVSVISIVGLGGLGKTTLAKSVYNDERVNSYFQLKMWVCVSDHFDVKELIKKIINSATNDTKCGDLTMDQLQNRLRDTLKDKMFLLILDDVWNPDHGKWVDLKNLVMVGACSGSKIIVTTRILSVANTMSTVPIYELENLSNEDSISLFVKWAFRKGEEKIYPNLLKIGVEIVKKCKGVPLAVRTLGSLLYSKTDQRDWVSVRDNEIWKLEQKENDILPSLRLSYDAMPGHLKQCFAFCSIFSKDFEFVSVDLVQLWMAQGFLHLSNESQELEDIGEQYIRELRWRSFFQDFEEVITWSTFKMHDLVHDLALLVTESECSTISSCSSNISNRLRHVSFVEKDLSGLQLQLHNLRTIRCHAGLTSESLVETCISRFKYLRVLDLSYSRFKVLSNSINKLKHLRYLDLSYNDGIKKLPSSICKLVHLQTLILAGCFELEELPRDIGNLISLRFLVLTTKQTILPANGIVHLNSLRSLWIVHCHNLKSLSEGILKSLTALRTLGILGCGSLESLPHDMKYLTRLETLAIGACGEFRALPERLPNLTSLHKLSLTFCSKLLISPEDWPKIAHITEINIEGRRIKSIDDLSDMDPKSHFYYINQSVLPLTTGRRKIKSIDDLMNHSEDVSEDAALRCFRRSAERVKFST